MLTVRQQERRWSPTQVGNVSEAITLSLVSRPTSSRRRAARLGGAPPIRCAEESVLRTAVLPGLLRGRGNRAQDSPTSRRSRWAVPDPADSRRFGDNPLPDEPEHVAGVGGQRPSCPIEDDRAVDVYDAFDASRSCSTLGIHDVVLEPALLTGYCRRGAGPGRRSRRRDRRRGRARARRFARHRSSPPSCARHLDAAWRDRTFRAPSLSRPQPSTSPSR
jgi:hypothetical protein